MLLKHVAIACRSEEQSDRFYGGLLGLEKIRSKTLPNALAKQIFDVDSSYKIIDYGNGTLNFEIFIGNPTRSGNGIVEHICLEVDDLDAFLEKYRDMDVKLIRVPKGESVLTFIHDFDGNVFEIKGKE